MKTGIHPPYGDTLITCACGSVTHTRSTVPRQRVAICARCHPLYSGRQKRLDTTGRSETFRQKYASLPGTERRQP